MSHDLDADSATALFLTESRELLDQLDNGLMALEAEGASASVDVNALFRAAHTIKGSAGVVGWLGVVEVTHALESGLDALRAGRRQPDPALCGLMLRATGRIAALLDAPADAPSDSSETRDVITALRAELSDAAPAAAAEPSPGAAKATAGAGQAEAAATNAAPVVAGSDAAPAVPVLSAVAAVPDAPPTGRLGAGDGTQGPEAEAASDAGWHLWVRFGPDAFRHGLDPLPVLAQLRRLGEVEWVLWAHDRLPPIDALDPERCHAEFDLLLAGPASAAAIDEALEFLQSDACWVRADASAAGHAERARALAGFARAERLALAERWLGLGLLDAAVADAARASLEAPAVQEPDPSPGGPSAASPVAPATPAPAPGASGNGAGAAASVTSPAGAEGQSPANRPPPEATATGEPAAAASERAARTDDGAGSPAAVAPASRRAAAPAPAAAAQQAQRFLRVPADRLDDLIEQIGELLIAGAGITDQVNTHGTSELGERLQRLTTLMSQVQQTTLSLRMVPIADTFATFRRVVRDEAMSLGKRIRLEVDDGGTEIDKTVAERLGEPLLHLIRNSIDHGLETPEVREAARKSPEGRLRLSARTDAGSVLIQVQDDGRGLDTERILAKAIERGLVAPGVRPPDAEIQQLIFEPGFSTASTVTRLSGRGVGMDAVRAAIESLRGGLSLASIPGCGTVIRIRLPVTLSMIAGLLVRVGPTHLVVPIEWVSECVELPDEHAEGGYVDLRGEPMPLLQLREYFRLPPHARTRARRSAVIVHAGEWRAGLVVDALLGEIQAVARPAGRLFESVEGLAGTSILGSGEIALVADVPRLLGRAVRRANGSAETSAAAA